MNKLKINLIGNFEDRKFEGSIKLVEVFKNKLGNKFDVSINSKDYNKFKFINIHSSGFLQAYKFRNINTKRIYSLHGNVVPIYFKSLKDFIQGLRYFYSREVDYIPMGKRILKFWIQISAQFIPISIKRSYLKKMDLVILPSIWLKKKFKLHNVKVIHHGINIKYFHNLNLKTNSNRIRIAFFGHPTCDKGMLEVLQVFSKLDHRFEKCIYPSKLTEKVKKTILNFSRAIKYNDYVEDLLKAYNNCDIVVLPYRHSSGGIATPLVLLEAMACERAVITTDLPHLREICGNSVLYVKPYNVNQIEKKIKLLAANSKLRKKLGQRARKRIAKYYNEEDMLKAYENLFEKMNSNK